MSMDKAYANCDNNKAADGTTIVKPDHSNDREQATVEKISPRASGPDVYFDGVQ